MKKKMMNEKKNVHGRSWMGYCPFSSSGRNIVGLYRDKQGTGLAYMLGRAVECCNMACYTASSVRDTTSRASDTVGLLLGASDSVHACPCHSGVAIRFLYRGRGRPSVSRQGAAAGDMALRYGVATWCPARYTAMRHSAQRE